MNTFNYVVDGLTFDKIRPLYQALMTIKEINSFNYDTDSQTLCVGSVGDQVESIEIALEIVGAGLRAIMSKI